VTKKGTIARHPQGKRGAPGLRHAVTAGGLAKILPPLLTKEVLKITSSTHFAFRLGFLV